ncbi:hypothetical protein AXF42_Ash009573 [Apostasia shenzhenica]|uniref:Uncharacterized protein n=1 Tax=Apostasia shenzhenica TaxID=1088818 RepID=A0A2I0B9C3_9ASPA|nr:hypothetical protein AXF42_Ash009573 [Apostasia shenzhenica]
MLIINFDHNRGLAVSRSSFGSVASAARECRSPLLSPPLPALIDATSASADGRVAPIRLPCELSYPNSENLQIYANILSSAGKAAIMEHIAANDNLKMTFLYFEDDDLVTWIDVVERQQGICTSWAECHTIVDKYPGALYFVVKSVKEAKQKIEDYTRLINGSSHGAQCNQGQIKDIGKQVVTFDNINIAPSGKVGAKVSIALLADFLAGFSGDFRYQFYHDFGLSLCKELAGLSNNITTRTAVGRRCKDWALLIKLLRCMMEETTGFASATCFPPSPSWFGSPDLAGE